MANESQILSDILRSQSQGGAAVGGGVLGAGADVPSVLNENPATRQLLEESIQTRAGNAAGASALSQRYTGRGAATTPRGVLTGGATTPATTGDAPVTSEAPVATGSYSDRVGSLYSDRYPQIEQKTQAELYAEEVAAMQGQIDALNAQYDARVGREEMAGVGRLGSTRALQSTAGTRFDPFGAAQTEQTRQYTSDAIAAINAERAAAISELFSEARKGATAQANVLTEQAVRAADSYISSIIQTYGLDLTAANQLREEAYRRAQLTGLTEDGNSTMAMLEYLQGVEQQAAENQRADAYLGIQQDQLAIQQEQLRRQGYDITQLPDGRYGYYDFTAGAPRFVEVTRYGGYTPTPTPVSPTPTTQPTVVPTTTVAPVTTAGPLDWRDYAGY